MNKFDSNRETLISLAVAAILSVTALAFIAMPVTAQDAPLARITLPIRGQTLRGGIAIQGSATAPQFTRYQVMYAPEPDTNNWIVINGAMQPVSSGTMAVWNTRPIPDGKYAVKLQVFSSDGSAVESIVRDINIANQTATPVGGAPAAAITTNTTNTLSVSTTAGISLQGAGSPQILNLADLPRAFVKGATYTGYAFGVLVAYLILKKLIYYVIRRFFRKPIDYGR